MGFSMKKMTVILLLTALLAPGIAQARTWTWESATVSRDMETGFFGMVWNLLAGMFEKTGGALDPSGKPVPTDGSGSNSSTTDDDGEEETGGALDPSGLP